MTNKDFDPIFSAGFHDISMDDLEDLFVMPFGENDKRENLVKRLREYIDEFEPLNLNAEIWIDGSFTTDDPDPSDVDLLFIFDDTELNSLSAEDKAKVTELFDSRVNKIRYNCDPYLIVSGNVDMRTYWRGLFGFSRSDKPKGIVRFNLS